MKQRTPFPDEIEQMILSYVEDAPISSTEIACSLCMTVPFVSTVLKTAFDAGMVVRIGKGSSTKWRRLTAEEAS